jgi:acyl-CoA-binding protein
VYEPDRGDEEDAFWIAAAQAAARADADDAQLSGDALRAAFEQAVASVSALAGSLPSTVLLRLRALYKQAGLGDVDDDRPGVADVVGRAKYDAWQQLRGISQEEAMSRYVSYARTLSQR